MFKSNVQIFYDSLQKCQKERCDNYTDGKCTVIDKETHDLCIEKLHTKFYTLDKENGYLRGLLQDLFDKVISIESHIDAINVIADFIGDPE